MVHAGEVPFEKQPALRRQRHTSSARGGLRVWHRLGPSAAPQSAARSSGQAGRALEHQHAPARPEFAAEPSKSGKRRPCGAPFRWVWHASGRAVPSRKGRKSAVPAGRPPAGIKSASPSAMRQPARAGFGTRPPTGARLSGGRAPIHRASRAALGVARAYAVSRRGSAGWPGTRPLRWC